MSPETESYLSHLAVFGVRLGLSRIETLLLRLGNPEKKYKTIHITGTNGKGSTARFITDALKASGIRTGLYTSPHLECYEERFEVDGEIISEKDFEATILEVKRVTDEMATEGEECPTQFEVLTAVAFLYFAKQKVEYAVIEVGLGGLLDSTNVIFPEISVITNVTLEHADKCGGTLEGVAKHKAGIIKTNVPVVTAAQGMPLEIIKKVAAEKNSKLYVLGEDFFVEKDEDKLIFSDNMGETFNYSLKMNAPYQRENSSIAVETLSVLAKQEPRINKETSLKAISNSVWAGRFELFNGVLLDGAHNPAGMSALRKSLDEIYPNVHRTFLLGVLADKAVDEMAETLLRPSDEVIVTSPVSERAMKEEELLLIVKNHTGKISVAKSIEEGIVELKKCEGLKIACGSLYLVGEVRRLLNLKS